MRTKENTAVVILRDLIVEAISVQEDFHLTEDEARRRGVRYPSKAQKNNNPGNLQTWGSYPIQNGTVRFPSVADGERALNRLIERNIARGLTFLELFAGKQDVYDGFCKVASIEEATTYAVTVADYVSSKLQRKASIPVDTVIQDLAVVNGE